MQLTTAPDEVMHVTGCDLDWTGPRRAWDSHLSGMHAMRHRKGRDGLSACCPGLTIRPGDVLAKMTEPED
jgi:hypothetical protein